MTNFETPRQIRQVLFQVPGAAALKVRKELFSLGHEAQDKVAPAKLSQKALAAVRDYEAL